MLDESWFGALGEGDTDIHVDDIHDAPRAVPRLARRGAQLDAQRNQTREARRVATSGDTALRRVFRTYVAARAVLGLLLALALMAVCFFSGIRALGLTGPDEPRYAAIARTAVHHRPPVTPRSLAHPYRRAHRCRSLHSSQP